MVYVFKLNDYDYYKIGIARDVKKRLRDINSHNPLNVVCVKIYETINDLGVEKSIHKHFKDKNIKYEWFNLTIEDVHYIDELVKIHNVSAIYKYIKPVRKKESVVELTKKVVELYNIHKIGMGTMNFQKTLKEGERVMGCSDRIVGNILNISKGKVRSLRTIYNKNPELLTEIDNGNLSIHSAYNLIISP